MRRKDSAGQFQEGVVHGHIHNFNNMTYIHGHIHHNAQYHGEGGLGDTKNNDALNEIEQSHNGNHGIPGRIGESAPGMNSLDDPSMQFIDCVHFEFMDPNGTIPNNFNVGLAANSTSQSGMNGIAQNFGSNAQFQPNHNQRSGLESSISSGRRSSRISLSDDLLNTPLSKKRKTSSESSTTDVDCSCNPKLLEVCCEVEHHPNNNINAPQGNVSLNGNQEYMQSSLNESKVLNQYLSFSPPQNRSTLHRPNDADFNAKPSSQSNHRKNSMVNINDISLSQYKQILDLNCDLTCEPMCPKPSENTTQPTQTNVVIAPKLEQTNSPIKTGEQASPIETGNTITDSGDMLDNFFQACERVGEYNECHNPEHNHSASSHMNSAKGGEKHMSSIVNQQYHTHTSSKQLDMKIISDICAISDLYETPIGGHMNHHHHMHSREDGLKHERPLMRTESYNILHNVMKCQPTGKSENNTVNREVDHPRIEEIEKPLNHHHHHHKIQVHNHGATEQKIPDSDKYVSCERFKADYKSPFNKGGPNNEVSDTITMYHQNDHTQVKDENTEQTSTINFNWNFKKDTENPDFLECQWGDCHQHSTSLIDLQNHLFKDHLSECRIPSNPVNIKPDTPHAGCKWQGCDFQSNDICSFVNHINSAHGINFDMKFIDPETSAKRDSSNFMGKPHHTYHCKKDVCSVEPPMEEGIGRNQKISHQENISTSTFEAKSRSKVNPDVSANEHLVETKPLHCEWDGCQEIFSTAEELDNHLINFHLPKGQSSYDCQWKGCGRKLSTRQKIIRHLKKHSGHKPFLCQVCEKRFATKESLYQHGRTHTGERPYKCPLCDKTFSTSTFVNVHIRTHTGEKPLECSICGKSFSESSNLNKHRKTHLKEFKCEKCLRSFSTVDKYERHQKTCGSTE